MPPTFFDTDALIRAKVDVKYLTLERIDSAWGLLDNSPVLISRKELGNYLLSFEDAYEYKYALVALKQKHVVGIALFSDLDTEVLLNHLYVLPIARFQGIGTKLMTQLQRYAGNREISKIDTSSSYMPWMNALREPKEILAVSHRLGSFYKKV
jgi:GNAT superfamily N-acetyltransferase